MTSYNKSNIQTDESNGWEGMQDWNFNKIYEIIGPDGTVHYTRPEGHPMIEEAKTVKGYSVRLRV